MLANESTRAVAEAAITQAQAAMVREADDTPPPEVSCLLPLSSGNTGPCRSSKGGWRLGSLAVVG